MRMEVGVRKEINWRILWGEDRSKSGCEKRECVGVELPVCGTGKLHIVNLD